MLITQSVKNLKPSYIREILAAVSSENVISFAGGLPDEKVFPLSLMASAFEEICDTPVLFQYANSFGYLPLINHLKDRYNIDENNNLLITNGSQQGLDLIARTCINNADQVLVEAPSYLGALQVFELANAEVLSVPLLNDGPDIEKLEQIFIANKIKFFYLIADFHNPTGICYSLNVRKKVAALCRQYNVWIIEDAPYRELRFSGEELPLVSSFYPECSFVLRSFSKLVCPGFRLGVVEAPSLVVRELVKVKQITDIHSNLPLQFVLLKLLQHPDFEKHLLNLRNGYKTKHDLMLVELAQTLGEKLNVQAVEGGMFIWLELNQEPLIGMLKLSEKLLEVGVAVVPGEVFCLDAKSMKTRLRLNFSNATHSDIKTGVSRLAHVLKQELA